MALVLRGAYELVNTPEHPAKGLRNEHFANFSPRLGIAFRPDDKTVVRAGWGSFFISSDLQFPESSAQSPLSYITNNPVSTRDGGVTPYVTLDNPMPTGLTQAPGRQNNFQQLLLGGSANALNQNEENGVAYQWNFAVQRQMPLGIALELHMPACMARIFLLAACRNQVPKAVFDRALADPTCAPTVTSACFLQGSTANPFTNYASTFTQGSQQYPTVPKFQLYRPFPQYGNISNTGNYVGFSNYNSLQVKGEKRFSQGGVFLLSYTFSKLMANAESLTSWLEVVGAPAFRI